MEKWIKAAIPALLSQRFGVEKVSQPHGLALTAWAIAVLIGNIYILMT